MRKGIPKGERFFGIVAFFRQHARAYPLRQFLCPLRECGHVVPLLKKKPTELSPQNTLETDLNTTIFLDTVE